MAENKRIINREAIETNQGFRYQKIRAATYILDALASADDFYFAVEYLDDVYGKTYNGASSIEILEQDKYYDEESSFTFSSKEVYKSIVNFLDKWLEMKRTKAIQLLLCATNKIGKEKYTEIIKDLQIVLPSTPILKLLINRDYKSDKGLLNAIKALIVHYYRLVYEGKPFPGYISEIEKFEIKDWIEFLDKIEYLSEQDNNDETKKQVYEKIKECNLFDSTRHKDKEDYIYSRIIDLLDEKIGKDLPANFVSQSDIKLIFKDLATQEQTILEDPSWNSWEDEFIEDSRGMEDKIRSVCETFDVKKCNSIKRRISSSILEEQKAHKNSFLAQKYRIFEECIELLCEKISNKSEFTEEDIELIIEDLCKQSELELNEWAKTYNYPYNNKKTIKGMVLNLFNECYLAFDDLDKQ